MGSRRSLRLPMTSVGTVRFRSEMCFGPSESTNALAQPPRPAGGVAANSSKTKSAIAGSASRPTARAATSRRLCCTDPGTNGAAPNRLSSSPPARTRLADSGRGTGSSFTSRSRSPVVVLISATASAHWPTRAGYRCDHDVIAMPPIECPAMTARSPGAKRGVQDGVEVGGQEVQSVAAALAAHSLRPCPRWS